MVYIFIHSMYWAFISVSVCIHVCVCICVCVSKYVPKQRPEDDTRCLLSVPYSLKITSLSEFEVCIFSCTYDPENSQFLVSAFKHRFDRNM